jgi:hypothetical protein
MTVSKGSVAGLGIGLATGAQLPGRRTGREITSEAEGAIGQSEANRNRDAKGMVRVGKRTMLAGRKGRV